MNPLQPEEIKLLTEVGFLAGARGDLQSARAIFGALEQCRPAACFPYAGLAMALLNRRQYDDAVRTLDRGLRQVTEAADVAHLHAVRALVLHLAGRASESDRAVRAAGKHPLALALAAAPSAPRPAPRA
jgi:hypothetical protein